MSMKQPTTEKESPPIEYAALDFDGTERRANYRTIAYREDILCLCEHKDAAAIVYEVVYWWQTNVRKREVLKEVERRKKNGQPPMTEEEVENMMWVWMSYNDFVRESGEAVAYNTVIRMLDYLVGTAQILECRENHDPRYPDYEYRIRMDVVKEKLKALPASPAFLPKVPKKKDKKGDDSTQVGTPQKRSTQKGRRAQKSTQVGIVSTQKGTATTQMGTEVYPNRGTSHNYSHNPHIQHTEEEGTLPHDHADTGAIVPTPALSQDRDATYEEAWEAYKRIELNYARTNQMLAKGETPALSHDSYSHDTPTHEEDTDGHSHTDMAFHGGTLPARSNTHSQLASAANSAAREVAHGHRAPTFAQHGRTDPAQTSQQQATAERVAPPDSNGYENTDEDTVSVPAQQLSTSVPQSGKVSHARTEGRKKKAEAPEPITLSPEARAIWRAWCSLFTVEVELIPSNAAAAEKLVKPARAWCGKLHWTLAEWLKAIKDNAYEADNKGYYSKRGVKLFDIPRELEGWQSAKEHEIDQAKRPQTNTSAGTFSGLPRWTPVYPQA